MQSGNMYYFKSCKSKGIELCKTITYEELLKTICQILRVDPRESNVLIKYVFSANIPVMPHPSPRRMMGRHTGLRLLYLIF